jgi:hypothetical protein
MKPKSEVIKRIFLIYNSITSYQKISLNILNMLKNKDRFEPKYI